MTATPESGFKKKVKKYLRSIGAYYVPVPGGAFGKNGSGDLIVCYRGAFIQLEAKANDGEQSGWQDLRECQVTEAGGMHATVWTMEEVEALFESLDYLKSPFR